MPFQDRTGPMGQGPMTGRGFGPCGFGFGFRRRNGLRRGMGRYFSWLEPQTKAEQAKALADYRKALEEELEDIRKEEATLAKE